MNDASVELRALPPGWAWATLKELVPLEYGKALPKDRRENSGTVPVYGSAGIIGAHAEPLVDGPVIIVGRKGSAGSVYLSEVPCWPIDTAYYGLVGDHIDHRFAHFLLSHTALGRLDQSTAIPSLSRDIYNGIKVPFPPLAEQRRIAAKIEEFFGEVEAGKQELEKALEGLASYRRAVLKSAVTGELTRSWREKNKPSETGAEYLDRILSERRANTGVSNKAAVSVNAADLPELPPSWAWASLDQLSTLITSGSRGWKRFYATEGKIFIRAQNLKHDQLDLSDVAYVTLPKDAEGVRTKVKLGDILITITGANVTKSGRVKKEIGDAYVNQHVGLVRSTISEISEFLFYVIICPTQGRRQLEQAAYGAGKPGLSLGDLAAVRIPLPPLEEQRIICDRIRAAFNTLENTLEELEDAANSIPVWRLATLAAAFSGKLVPQDPSDEPASSLLERLRVGMVAAASVPEKSCTTNGKIKTGGTVRRRSRKCAEGTRRGLL